jgi:hypothetical protein
MQAIQPSDFLSQTTKDPYILIDLSYLSSNHLVGIFSCELIYSFNKSLHVSPMCQALFWVLEVPDVMVLKLYQT